MNILQWRHRSRNTDPRSVCALRRILRLAAHALALAVFLPFSVAAQPEGYTEIPQLSTLVTARLGCPLPQNGVYDEAQLEAALRNKSCAYPILSPGVDFQTQTLIGYGVGSDCHMRVTTKVFRSDAEKKYKVIINNIYGGCRAGGWRRGWIVIEKLPEDYTLEIVEVKVDRIHGVGSDSFAFPKPPSTKTRVSLETREVDLKGCRPTAGMAQWVIRSSHHFETGPDLDETEKKRCLDHFKSLNIDFETHTLVHYAFENGHCARPPDLRFETIREFSSDARENRNLLRISFRSAGADYCRTWTTYPLWVIVPKLPEGFRFDFQANAVAPAQESAAEKLETRSINLQGCIQMHFTRQFVIRNNETYLKAIRNDAGRDRCLQNVEPIDFDTHTLVGINLNTGYCRVPAGLEYQATRDNGKKEYTLSISWQSGGICRAMSQYDLWVLVPKLPNDYGLVFEPKAI
jgi:hypothetical protein